MVKKTHSGHDNRPLQTPQIIKIQNCNPNIHFNKITNAQNEVDAAHCFRFIAPDRNLSIDGAQFPPKIHKLIHFWGFPDHSGPFHSYHFSYSTSFINDSLLDFCSFRSLLLIFHPTPTNPAISVIRHYTNIRPD